MAGEHDLALNINDVADTVNDVNNTLKKIGVTLNIIALGVMSNHSLDLKYQVHDRIRDHLREELKGILEEEEEVNEEKQQLITWVMNDIKENRYNYDEYLLDVMHEYVKKWDVDSLRDFLGMEEEDPEEEGE